MASLSADPVLLDAPADRRLLAPLLANWWIPFVIALLVYLSPWVEGGQPMLGVTWDKFWRQISYVVGINITLAVSLQLINGIAGQFSLGHAGFMAVGAYLGGFAVSAYGGKVVGEDTVEWANPGGVLLYLSSVILLTVLAGALLYGVYRLIRLTAALHPRGPALVFMLLATWLLLDVIAKNKVSGNNPLGAINGIILIGRGLTAAFDGCMTHGAGVATWISDHLPRSFLRPACLICSIIGGGIMAGIVGFVVGLPTLRLRGDYLAIATLGVSELIRTAINNSPTLGRSTGLSVPTFQVDADPAEHIAPIYYLPWIYGVALLTILIVWRIQRSPKGRALECLREDEIAAGAVGIDVAAHKVMAFVIGAALAGMGGALFAHYIGYINPKVFDMTKSVELVVMVTLGGLGSVPGTIIAAILLSLLQPALQTATSWMPRGTPASIVSGAELANKYRLVIYALLLILAMHARSLGWFSFRKRKHSTLASGT